MPLVPGKQNIGRNIKKMKKEGYPDRVAKAAALNKAYGPKKKSTTKPVRKPKMAKPSTMKPTTNVVKPKIGNMRRRRGKMV